MTNPSRELRKQAHYAVWKAVNSGLLPKLDGSIECSDCGEPATCYDHRNYYYRLSVDPVCSGCNNRRGAGFPAPSGDPEYSNGVEGSSGTRWSVLEGGEGEGGPEVAHAIPIESKDIPHTRSRSLEVYYWTLFGKTTISVAARHGMISSNVTTLIFPVMPNDPACSVPKALQWAH